MRERRAVKRNWIGEFITLYKRNTYFFLMWWVVLFSVSGYGLIKYFEWVITL